MNPVRCKTCRKTPRNCRCFVYRLEPLNETLDAVFVDNVATEPVRGEEVGTWQTRRNSKIYSRPQFVDDYGPILYLDAENSELVDDVDRRIKNGTFFIEDFKEVEGARLRPWDRESKRRLPFLRRARKRKVAASSQGFLSCT